MHVCSESTEHDGPATSEVDEGIDEARRGTAISRRSMLRGLGYASAAVPLAPALSALVAASPAAASGSAVTGARLVLLGTRAGPPITASQTGIASALVIDGATYVIDCGRAAVSQYVAAGLRLDSLRAMFVTHLHADHIADYYNFFMLGAAVPNNDQDIVRGPVQIYGPGPAGGLPSAFGGGTAPTVAPENPTPGIASMTDQLHRAYAYGTNMMIRDGIRDPRNLTAVHEIALPAVGATYENTAPAMAPFEVYRDENVVVSAVLVPHGPVFPAFAFRFDTAYGSVTFSGDTRKTPNLIDLAQQTDILVHEAIRFDPATTPDWIAHHHLDSHVLVEELGPIAEEARAAQLVMSHTSDFTRDPINRGYWTSSAQHGYRGKVVLGRDLETFQL